MTDEPTFDIPADVLAAAQAAPEPEPELPLDKPKPSNPKPRRSRAKAAQKAKGKAGPNPAHGLIEALKFVSPAQAKNGTVSQTFCNIAFGWVAASNGILTIATKIEEADLTVCPHSTMFADALSQVETEMSITQVSASYLSVASGEFRGVVPCVSPDQVPITPPDDPVAIIDDRIKHAFEAVLKVPNEQSPEAYKAGALLQAGSVVATTGAIIVEYWHGIDLPPGMLLPKAALQAVAKAKKPLERFGFSGNSATFWFEDGSFIKTQLFAERFPQYSQVIDDPSANFWPVPDRFFSAVETVAKFNEHGKVYFKEGEVVSDLRDETPSLYKIDGLPEGVGFDSKLIAIIKDKAQRIAFGTDAKGTPLLRFIGDNIRGAIAALETAAPSVYGSEESGGRSTHGGDFDDDEIPF